MYAYYNILNDINKFYINYHLLFVIYPNQIENSYSLFQFYIIKYTYSNVLQLTKNT